MTQLSVNVNKIATLRNARGKNQPNLLAVVTDILRFGAKGITVHPRPDERHIRKQDVFELNELIRELNANLQDDERAEFNIEGFPSHEFISMIETVSPDQCTLVPDPPDALTSEAGWLFAENETMLTWAVGRLRDIGVRSSLFIDVFSIDESETNALLAIKPDRIELYTEAFANAFGTPEEEAILRRYKEVALQFYDLGLGINAGHDLNLENLPTLKKHLPFLEEVSIGHALICESLYFGLEKVIKTYLAKLGHSQWR